MSWAGAIRVETGHDTATGRDRFRVLLLDWPSKKVRKVLSEGFLDEHHRYAYCGAREPVAA